MTSAIFFHSSWVGSVPVGLCAQAWRTKMEPSGAFCRERSHDEGQRTDAEAVPLHRFQDMQPTHLQVIQEPGQVQTAFSRVPVVVRTDVFETGVPKHAVVVL